jgi:hypothetical protein
MKRGGDALPVTIHAVGELQLCVEALPNLLLAQQGSFKHRSIELLQPFAKVDLPLQGHATAGGGVPGSQCEEGESEEERFHDPLDTRICRMAGSRSVPHLPHRAPL